MSEAEVFISTGQYIGPGQTVQFVFQRALDDAYWDVKILARGAGADLEIVRQFVSSDAAGTRRLHYVVRNNKPAPAAFTRTAVRIPAT
jgi:hypothetical protein